MISDLAKYRIEVALGIMNSGKSWQIKDEDSVFRLATSLEDYLDLAQIMIDASIKMDQETQENKNEDI